MAEKERIENMLSDDELDAVSGGRRLVTEIPSNTVDKKDSLRGLKDHVSQVEGLIAPELCIENQNKTK